MPNLQDTRRRASRARVLLAEDHPLFSDMLQLLPEVTVVMLTSSAAVDDVDGVASAQLPLTARRAA